MVFVTNIMIVTPLDGFMFIETSKRTWSKMMSFQIKATQAYWPIAYLLPCLEYRNVMLWQLLA
jgi:hypothetical protein